MGDVERGFGYLLHDVARLRRYEFDRALKPLGLTRAQWWVIVHLLREDKVTQAKLAETLDLHGVTLSGILDRMETAGWVERRPDPNDRRANRIHLTDQIEEIRDALVTTEDAVNEGSLEGLTESEKRQLVNLLKRVRTNLNSPRRGMVLPNRNQTISTKS